MGWLFLKHSWRYACQHPWLSLLNVLGVALGITVFVAVQVVNQSALQSFRASVDVVAGRAQLEVVGDGAEFADAVYFDVAGAAGVSAATPLVEVVARVVGGGGDYVRVLGIEVFSFAPFQTFRLLDARGESESGSSLDLLTQPRGIAITQEMARRLGKTVGDGLLLRAGGEQVEVEIVQLLAPRDEAVGWDEAIAVMDIAHAQEAFGRVGRLSRVQLQHRPQVSAEAVLKAVQQVVPEHLLVQRPERRSAQVEQMLGAFQLNLVALSLVSLLVGVFVIYNTVSAAVVRRRRELGLLRCVGFTGWQVRGLVVGEALVTGVIGMGLGIAAGVGLAAVLVEQVSTTITSLYVLMSIRELFVSPASIAAALGLGVGTVFVAAWLPAREAGAVSPLEVMREGSEGGAREMGGRSLWRGMPLGLIVAAVGCGWGARAWGSEWAWLSFGAALFTLLAFAAAVPAVVRGVMERLPLGGVWERLVREQFLRSLQRHGVTIAALLTALGMLVGVSVMIFSFRQTVAEWLEQSVRADLFVADASHAESGLSEILSPRVLEVVEGQRGVAAVDTYRELRVVQEAGAFKVVAIRFDVAAERNPLQFRKGHGGDLFPRARAGGMVMVSDALAQRLRLGEGDRVELMTPMRGRQSLEICGVFSDYTTDQGVVLMDAALFAEMWGDVSVNSLALYLKPEAEASVVQQELKRALEGVGECVVYSNAQLRQEVFRIFDQTFRVTYVLQTVALLVSGVGIFLNLVVILAERRRELAVWRAMGMRRAELTLLVVREGVWLAGWAVVLGVPAGLALAWVLNNVINIAYFGWTIRWATPWAFLISLPPLVLVTGVTVSAWAAGRAQREPLVAALRV